MTPTENCQPAQLQEPPKAFGLEEHTRVRPTATMTAAMELEDAKE